MMQKKVCGSMNIIVMGCGKIGTTVVESLITEGHDVLVVDKDPDVITEITNIYDAMGVCGNGADCDTLNEANINSADLFVAVSGSDELNMLACFLAKKMGAKHTICRIRNPEYNEKELNFMRQHLEISLAINPEALAGQELYNLLKLPSAVKVETFSGKGFEMVELILKPDSKLDGLSLIELRKKFRANYLVCVVQRGEEVFIPDGSFVLRAGDKIGLSASVTEIQKLLKLLEIQQKQARSVIIMGASRIAYYLSRLLLNSGNSVKLIEQNKDRAAHISEILPGAVIINGDGAQQELLLEEGIRSTDAFVSLTGMDELNILISCYANSQNVPKVITKVNREELSSMASKLGLETIVSPRRIVANILVRYARALENSLDSQMETLYKLMGDKAEALEFNVLPDFKYINTPLKDMKLKANILIAGIVRGRRSIIPAGDDVILPGDRVIIIAAGQRVRNLSDIIA